MELRKLNLDIDRFEIEKKGLQTEERRHEQEIVSAERRCHLYERRIYLEKQRLRVEEERKKHTTKDVEAAALEERKQLAGLTVALFKKLN